MFGKQPIWGDDFLNELANSKMGLNLSRGSQSNIIVVID